MRHDSLPWLRIFLDANVLISASLTGHGQFLDLWRMARVTQITSKYAVDESMRNLKPAAQLRLENLLLQTELVMEFDLSIIPAGANLVMKDQPILAGAVSSRSDYLLTGDQRHFAHLYGQTIAHVRIIPPGQFLEQHQERIPNPGLR